VSGPDLDVVADLPLAADLARRLDALQLHHGWLRRFNSNHRLAGGLLRAEEAEVARLLDLDPPRLRLPGARELFAVPRVHHPVPPTEPRRAVVLSVPTAVDWTTIGDRDARAAGVAVLTVSSTARTPVRPARPVPRPPRGPSAGAPPSSHGGFAGRVTPPDWTPPPRLDRLGVTVRGTPVHLQRFEAHLTRVTWPLRSATGSDSAWVALMAPWSPRTALELLLRHDVLPVSPRPAPRAPR